MLSLLAQLLKALNSENSTRQISLALVFSLIFALSPLLSLQAILILFIVLLVKVHLASFIVGITLFEGLAYLLTSVCVLTGEWLLTSAVTHSFFSGLYQFDWFKLAQLHHTYNIGSLAVGLILAFPCYVLMNFLIVKYRHHIQSYFERLAIVKTLKATRIFQIYQQLPSAGDK